MSYKPKYSEEDVMKTVEQTDLIMLCGIKARLGCSEQTARNLIMKLVKSGRVIKKNIGTEKKPTNIYYLPDKPVYSVHSEIIDHEPSPQHQGKYEGDDCVQFVTKKEHKQIHESKEEQTCK
jgi:hypothetical protein